MTRDHRNRADHERELAGGASVFHGAAAAVVRAEEEGGGRPGLDQLVGRPSVRRAGA